MYLPSSTSRHLPQTHPLAPDFKIQYLLSILPSPAFRPNHQDQLVPFFTLHPSKWASPPDFSLSVCLYHCSSSSLPGCTGQRTHKKDRCAHPSWQRTDQAVKNGHHRTLLAASLKYAMPGLSSTGSCRHSNTPQRSSLLNSSEYE